ncbi:lipopolysaccharide biosynthesis protein [Arsenicicoccus sp. oral taxon 190]|uniref:lipopolysaccharide biosynthesis protein n=1 Tax=Arsenicicoccus sp. oral taxon 190 TaxID=1658671 RepID=UPI00067C469E|nr:lipopolysaccharide biosynthesis protein [Arsenicicoccus sp. oral taxon 190]
MTEHVTDEPHAPREEEQQAAPQQRRVGTSTIWNVLQYGGSKVVTFVSTVVLARLLAPEAFGLVALALLAINIFDRLKDLGVGTALVQHSGSWRRIAPTGATLTVLLALGFGAACLLTAPWLAAFLGNDALTPLIRALSVSMLLQGLTVFPDAALRRYLAFRERTLPELAGAVVKAAVSISLAVGGAGAWSLVWGQVAATAVMAVLYWLVYLRATRAGATPVADEPEHRFGWDGQAAGELVRFGGSLSLLALLALVIDNLDYFSIGRRLGETELGYYTMAFRLPELVVVGVCVVIGQVLFSSFSRLQDDPAALREHYLRAISAVATLTVPLGLGLAAAAGPIVLAVFGEQYSPSEPILVVLGAYSAIFALGFHAGEVYKATGHAGLLNRLAVAQVLVFGPALWWAAGRSTLAVAVAFLACHTAFTVLRLIITARVIGIPVSDQLRAVAPAVLAALVMAAAVTGLDRALPAWAPLVLLVVEALAGAVAYVAVLSLLDRQALPRVLRPVRPGGAA